MIELGCKTQAPKNDPIQVLLPISAISNVETTKQTEVGRAWQITFEGDNSMPAFSPNSDNLLFVSRQRKAHAHTQIYAYNLLTKSERRMTFQSGDNAWPLWVNPTNYIYFSSTDELKERPSLVYEPQPAAESILKFFNQQEPPPYDIYIHNTDQNHQERLTENPGFDGFPTLQSQLLTVTSSKDGKAVMRSLSFQTGKQISMKIVDPIVYSVPAPNQKMSVALEVRSNGTALILKIPMEPDRLVAESPQSIQMPAWLPNSKGFVFAAKLNNDTTKDIWFYDVTKLALQKVLSTTSEEDEVALAPSGDLLAYTSGTSDTKQIYIIGVGL